MVITMTVMMENAATVCGVLIAIGLIGKLCPKNKMLSFVQSLIALVLMVSLVAALFHVEWDGLNLSRTEDWQNKELNEYVDSQYKWAAQKETENYLEGLLRAAGLEAKKITTDINITGDNRIVLTRVTAEFCFESDAQRAQALLLNALGESIAIEVKTDGT